MGRRDGLAMASRECSIFSDRPSRFNGLEILPQQKHISRTTDLRCPLELDRGRDDYERGPRGMLVESGNRERLLSFHLKKEEE